MYEVTAELINVFAIPASEKYPESFKLQLMGDNPMKDGQIKKDMLTLNVPSDVYIKYKEHLGQMVTLPVAFFVSNNKLNPFYPKGAELKVD